MIILLFSLTVVATFFTTAGYVRQNGIDRFVSGIFMGGGIMLLIVLFILAWYLQDTLLTMNPIL